MQGMEVRELSKSYPGVWAVKNISFKLSKGRIHGLLGPNGAGKSTTMKMMAALIRPNSGSVLLNGKEIFKKLETAKINIGILPETPPLYFDMKVEDYLHFVCEVHNVKKNDREELVERAIKELGLLSVRGRLIGNLSKGYKQRVGVAQAIVHRPPVIILDEPTAGLDPKSIQEVRSLLQKLKQEHTILLSTHLLHEAKMLCDDITIINHGEVLRSGPLSEVVSEFWSQRKIWAEVKSWDEEIKSAMLTLPQINAITREGDKLFFSLATEKDCRETIISHLVQFGARPVAFGEEEVQLEEIFLELMKNTIELAAIPPPRRG